MSFLQAIRCKLGTHDYGEPEYAQERRCAQVQRCRRCGAVRDLGTAHDWDEWAYEIPPQSVMRERPGQCMQVRRCRRDRATEHRERHQWDGPAGPRDVETHWLSCARCGARKDEPHDWDPGLARPQDDETHWEVCGRCRYEEARPHDWSTTKREQYSAEQDVGEERCAVCGATRPAVWRVI